MTNLNVRTILGLAIVIAATSVLQSCTKSADTTTNTGDWVKRSSIPGADRSNAVAFEINGLGYLGTGFDGTTRLTDFWEYDPTQDNWIQKADVPGQPRSEAVGFSVLGKGYVGLGWDGTTAYSDFYEFDPSANTWTQKADFGTTIPAQVPAIPGRYAAVAFSIDPYGYVGTGYDITTKKDFFKYDPSADIWSPIVVFGGEKRMSAAAFVINGKAYVGTGVYNGSYQKDFFAYDPATGLWAKRASLYNGYDIKRYGAAAFSVNNKGYISTGTYTSAVANTWEYTPPSVPGGLGYWTQKGGFEGSARTAAVGLTIGNKGYVLTGKNGNNRYGDMWEFYPNATQVY